MEKIPELVRAIPAGVVLDHGLGKQSLIMRTTATDIGWSIDMDPAKNITGVYVDDPGQIANLVDAGSPVAYQLGTLGSRDTVFYKAALEQTEEGPVVTARPIARLGLIHDELRGLGPAPLVTDEVTAAKYGLLSTLWELKGRRNLSDIVGPELIGDDEIISVCESSDILDDEGYMVLDESDLELVCDSSDFDPVRHVEGTVVLADRFGTVADRTLALKQGEYGAVRRELFDRTSDRPVVADEEVTDRMTEAEILERIFRTCEHELGFSLRESNVNGRQVYMVVQDATDDKAGLPIPDFGITAALDAVKAFDKAIGLYDELADIREVRDARDLARMRFEHMGPGADRLSRISFVESSDWNYHARVQEAQECYRALDDASKKAAGFFRNSAKEDALIELTDRMTSIEELLYENLVLGELAPDVETTMIEVLKADEEQSGRGDAAQQYLALVRDGSFRGLDRARTLAAEKFSEEKFYSAMIRQLDSYRLSAAFDLLGDAIDEGGIRGAVNTESVYRNSSRTELNEIARSVRRFVALVRRDTWADLKKAKDVVRKGFQGSAYDSAMDLIETRLDTHAHGIANRMVTGQLGHTYVPHEVQKQVFAQLAKTGDSVDAALALGIASRNHPNQRKNARMHFMNCLEREMEVEDRTTADRCRKVDEMLSVTDMIRSRQYREEYQSAVFDALVMYGSEDSAVAALYVAEKYMPVMWDASLQNLGRSLEEKMNLGKPADNQKVRDTILAGLDMLGGRRDEAKRYASLVMDSYCHEPAGGIELRNQRPTVVCVPPPAVVQYKIPA